jgi:NADPH-dependent ferric siderophore reductase
VERERPQTAARVERHTVEVIQTTDITSWYRRLDCAGHGLLPQLSLAPASYLLLHFADSASEAARTAGEAPGPRAYTIVRPDVAADRFSLDFVLHEPPGLASAWAAQAVPGTTIEVSEPPHHLVVPAPLRHALLVGDASAAAALDSILRCLPASAQATVLFIDPHADRDAVPLAARPGTVTRRLPTLADADLALPPLDPAASWLWAAGERALAKQVRLFARASALPRDRQHIQTYWVARA